MADREPHRTARQRTESQDGHPRRSALAGLAAGAEVMLRAAADALAHARDAANEAPRATDEATGRTLLRWVDALLDSADDRAPALLAELRAALHDETQRWDERASDDPVAARVRDLFAAARDVLEPRSDQATADDASDANGTRSASPGAARARRDSDAGSRSDTRSA